MIESKNETNLIVTEECSQLEEVSYSELDSYAFAPGVLFWKKLNGKHVKICDAGEMLTENMLAKFRNNNRQIWIERVINPELVLQGTDLLLKLKNSVHEFERIAIRKRTLEWFSNNYLAEISVGSLLDLVTIGYRVFNQFDDEIIFEMNDSSMILLSRSTLIAPLAVCLALGVGYLDYRFLSDVYNACLLIDYKLSKETLSYNIMKAMEDDRNTTMTPQALEENRKKAELKPLFTHVREGRKEALKNFAHFFSNREVLDLVVRHHERTDGHGFPFGLYESEMSDLEMIVVYLNHYVSYDYRIYKKGDCAVFFKELMSESNRLPGAFSSRLNGIMNDLFAL